jgi:hypothetical protein
MAGNGAVHFVGCPKVLSFWDDGLVSRHVRRIAAVAECGETLALRKFSLPIKGALSDPAYEYIAEHY